MGEEASKRYISSHWMRKHHLSLAICLKGLIEGRREEITGKTEGIIKENKTEIIQNIVAPNGQIHAEIWTGPGFSSYPDVWNVV